MPKIHVYELAKELDVDSKTLLTILKDMGEFVRSPSSTIEPPVVRRVCERLGVSPPGPRAPEPRITYPLRRPAAPAAPAPAEQAAPEITLAPFPIAPTWRAQRRRYHGPIADTVAVMLELADVDFPPTVGEHEDAKREAGRWGRLDFEASEVRAWVRDGVTDPDKAAALRRAGQSPMGARRQ